MSLSLGCRPLGKSSGFYTRRPTWEGCLAKEPHLFREDACSHLLPVSSANSFALWRIGLIEKIK